MNRKSLTLLELIISSVLLSIAIYGISRGSVFFVQQVSANIERQSIYSQINYTLDDLKLRCMGASKPYTIFTPGGTKSSLEFTGAKNIYNITPDSTSTADKWCYKYFYQPDKKDPKTGKISVPGGIILRSCNKCPCSTAGSNDEVLVDDRFTPTISFQHNSVDEPNFITVTITAKTNKSSIGGNDNISKSDGLRFWFIYVVK